MSVTRSISSAIVLSILATVACSSSTPEPQTAAQAPESAPPTDPAPTVAKAPAPAADEAKPQAAAQAKESTNAPPKSTAPESEPEPPAKAAPPAPPPRPSEILTAENVAFVLDDDDSALKLILSDKCEKRVGYNDEAIAKCVTSERSKFPADVLRFRKMSGQLRWTIYKQRGDQLQVVYSAPFGFTGETDYGVSLVIQGNATGYRPLMSQSSTVPLRFPSTDSIEIDDPIWGELVYKSKTGLAE